MVLFGFLHTLLLFGADIIGTYERCMEVTSVTASGLWRPHSWRRRLGQARAVGRVHAPPRSRTGQRSCFAALPTAAVNTATAGSRG
jgi:hypothetical protein